MLTHEILVIVENPTVCWFWQKVSHYAFPKKSSWVDNFFWLMKIKNMTKLFLAFLFLNVQCATKIKTFSWSIPSNIYIFAKNVHYLSSSQIYQDATEYELQTEVASWSQTLITYVSFLVFCANSCTFFDVSSDQNVSNLTFSSFLRTLYLMEHEKWEIFLCFPLQNIEIIVWSNKVMKL